MQLPLTTLIAGGKTVNDWNSLRVSLTDFNNTSLWTTTYDDFFIARLEDRYLTPIKLIKNNGSYKGEGFLIMTIICSLIEFLESTYQGKNYRYRRTGDPPLTQYEYCTSGQIFIDFFINHIPFNAQFNLQMADEFYQNIRCGLLHEARTNGNWIIRGNSSKGCLIEKTSTKTIIYRDDFFNALNQFINVDFKNELLLSIDRKEAFIRKFDKLCEE